MSGKCKIYWGLWPFSVLYGIGVRVRNLLFDRGLLRQERFPLPVICIGNLTVGGTGKTPHTEYLIRLLHGSFRLAVLSRGYKRKSKGFVLASPASRMEDIGDEPFQMARKFPDIRVAVDGDRCEGIHRLMAPEGAPDTEVVLLDDAFQHRYVQPGLNLLLMDYHRPVECDQLLPAGRLREPASGNDGPTCSSSPNVRPTSAWKNASNCGNAYSLFPIRRCFSPPWPTENCIPCLRIHLPGNLTP